MDRTDVMEAKKTNLMEAARRTSDPYKQLQIYMELHSIDEELAHLDS